MTPRLRLAALLLVAGCGGASPSVEPKGVAESPSPQLTHDQYQAAIMEIVTSDVTRQLSRLFTDIVTDEESTSSCKTKARAFADGVDELVDRAADLTPPTDAARAHADFVAAARESARLVEAAADDVDAGTLRCGDAVNDRIYGLPSTERATEAIRRLQEIGYFVLGE